MIVINKIDSKTITAICCLMYLIPDTRSKPDHELLVKFVPVSLHTLTYLHVYILSIQDNADIQLYGARFDPEPRIMVRGTLQAPKDAFLIVESNVLCKLSQFDRMCLLLVGTFYVFNMVYTKGLGNFFCFVETSLMGYKMPKDKFRVAQLMSLLSNA